MSVHFAVRLSATPFLIFALALAGAEWANAAKPVKPPVDLLYASPNLLVAGTLLEINPVGRLVFERGDVLGGKPLPPEKIDVRVSESILTRVKVGERYIFGYANVHTDRSTVERKLAANLGGANLLSSTGIEPALLHDTAPTRALLEAGRDERGRDSPAFFDLLMRALEGNDAPLRYLAAAEVALDPELRERVRRNGQATVERVTRDARVAPVVRTLLLQSAEQWPKQFGRWWRSAALDVVTATPIGGYAPDALDPTSLVLVALEVLDQHAVRVSADALKRWLRSSAPLLAERACLMLRRESPALERSAVREALADPNLPAQTRKFLADHQRRLDRQDARAKARKDGTG